MCITIHGSQNVKTELTTTGASNIFVENSTAVILVSFPAKKGKNHKNCVTFTLNRNMFERKPVLSGKVCATADLLPR
jgi:hypothetical protein